MNLLKFKQLEILHEDKRILMYKDILGIETIGIGHNLRANPISERAVDIIFEDDVNLLVLKDLNLNIPWWTSLDEVRQLVLADMCLNMGWSRLSAFKNTLLAVKEGRWEDAAKGMEHSDWYKQVGSRAVRLCKMMRLGELPEELK